MSAPTLHRTLVERAVKPELDRMERLMRDIGEDRIRYLMQDWRMKLERVYLEGVRDGFVQGVEAAAVSRGGER